MNIIKSNKHKTLLGVLSLLSTVVAAGSIAMIGFTSFTAFNPPGWLRIVTMVPFPFAIISSVGFGLAGLKKDSGLLWAVLGLVIASLSLVAFIAMLSAGG